MRDTIEDFGTGTVPIVGLGVLDYSINKPYIDCMRVSGNCPADRDEVADLFITGKLKRREKVAFQRHIGVCRSCKEVVQRTLEFRDALGRAVRQLGFSEKPESSTTTSAPLAHQCGSN